MDSVGRRSNIERKNIRISKPVNWDSFHNEGLGCPTLANGPICSSDSISKEELRIFTS